MRKLKKRIGFYLSEKIEGSIKMPTVESQAVLDKYLHSMSQDDVSYAEQMEETLTLEEHDLDAQFADEMVEKLKKDTDFTEGYELMDDNGKSHIWLLLFYQIIIRDVENKEYIKTFK